MTQPTPAEQLLNLADRAERHGGLTPTEAARLREGVAHHCARADTLEAVCESNKRAYVGAVKDAMAADERAKRAEQLATDLRAQLIAEQDVSRRLLEQRQEMAAERFVWQERGDRAEAKAAAMTAAMESTAADALKHRGCHMQLMGQCLRAERAEAAIERVRHALANQSYLTSLDETIRAALDEHQEQPPTT